MDDENVEVNLAYIRHRRMSLGISQEEMGKMIGMGRWSYSQRERGASSFSSPELGKTCLSLKMPIKDIYKLFITKNDKKKEVKYETEK